MSSDFRYPQLFRILLILLTTTPVWAGNDCAGIKKDSDRLACFDEQVDKGTDGKDPLENWQRTTAQKVPGNKSLLDERWELEKGLGRFIFRPYKPVYFFPLFYNDNVNSQPRTDNPRTTVSEPLSLDSIEAKFQLSFKTKLAEGLLSDDIDLWLGYTQTSRWQIYNSQESRPFRETNHEPEFILAWHTDYNLFGFKGRLLSLSLNHQSNGQDEPLSRSWNRVVVTVGLDRPDWVVLFRPWWRIPESADEEDENPGILDHIGRAELLLVHRRSNLHQVSTRFRHSLKGGDDFRGSIELNWSYPCFDRLRCHAQLFHGYGESLIDYNHETTALGLGVALLEWF